MNVKDILLLVSMDGRILATPRFLELYFPKWIQHEKDGNICGKPVTSHGELNRNTVQ